MKPLIFALLLASLASPLAAQRIDFPSVIAAAGASFADAAITSHVIASGRCVEKNPVFGSHPSDAKLYISTAATVSGLIALNYFMSSTKAAQRVSRILNWGIAGLEGSVVVHNVRSCLS